MSELHKIVFARTGGNNPYADPTFTVRCSCRETPLVLKVSRDDADHAATKHLREVAV